MDKRETTVVVGFIISLIIFLIVFYLQMKESDILQIESRWLLVCGIPVLIALIVGGYIQKFKGFGVEIEARLKSRLGNVGLKAQDALEQVEGQDKGDLSFLYDTPEEKLAEIERLILVMGRKNYYGVYALKEYMERLRNLKFIEIQDNQGKFLYILPASVFIEGNNIKMNLIERFIQNLEEGNIDNSLITMTENDYVKTVEPLIGILPKVRESIHGWLPVLNKQRKLMGVITKESIESRIADDVIAAKDVT
ncbi:hypothetical protein ACFL1Z_05805 [Thermodesulfobacteriota bacterium]